jgi:hypothetical protein
MYKYFPLGKVNSLKELLQYIQGMGIKQTVKQTVNKTIYGN